MATRFQHPEGLKERESCDTEAFGTLEVYTFQLLEGQGHCALENDNQSMQLLAVFKAPKQRMHYLSLTTNSQWLNNHCRGSEIPNVAPCPGWLSTHTLPPCASTNCLTIVNPIPEPPLARERDLSAR